MGKPKRGKTRSTGSLHAAGDDGEDIPPHQAYDITTSQPPDDRKEEGVKQYNKFELYQQHIRGPKMKTDIIYMKKFFSMYVKKRTEPFNILEDFCGTALLSLKWLGGDSQRTAICLDLDQEALNWCIENNLANPGAFLPTRFSLACGNVLKPLEGILVYGAEGEVKEEEKDTDLSGEACLMITKPNKDNNYSEGKMCFPRSMNLLPSRDIVCAFNYSCCFILRRTELLLYFKHALKTLSNRGGIFVMDLYGGTSSERKLKMHRFSNFTYVWEQKEFDTISRQTKIGLHFYDGEKCVIRDAFSYDWRLWSLPEIKDCMEEAGFSQVHFWIQETPIVGKIDGETELTADRDPKYKLQLSFPQTDSWNAYIVGVKRSP